MIEILKTFIFFLDLHAGSLTFLITFVYVIATIFICQANIKSAKSTREQVLEQKKQFEEEHRAFVTVDIEIIRSGLLAIRFQNHGKRIADNIKVDISSAFLENIPDKKDRDNIKKLCACKFSLGINQFFYINMGTHLDLHQLKKHLCEIEISYNDYNSNYSDKQIIDFNQYSGRLIYESPTEDIYQEIRKVVKELSTTNKLLNTKTIDEIVK